MRQEALSQRRFRRWRVFFHLGATFVVFVLVLLGTIYTVFSLQMPYLGMGVKLAPDPSLGLDSGKWVVDYADPGGLAYDLGVRPGDEVASVNGRPVAEVAGTSDHLHHSTIRQASVIQADGNRLSFELTNTGPLGMPTNTLVEAISLLGIGFVFLITALTMVFKGSRQMAVSGLGLLSGSLGMVIITNEAAARGEFASFQLQALSMLLAPALFWHLVYFFPSRQLDFRRAASLVLLPYLTTLVLFVPFLVTGPNGEAFPAIRSLILLHILFWCGLSVGRIWWTYRQPGLERFRAQVRIVGSVCGIALLPLLLLSILPEIAGLPWKLLPQASLIPTVAVPLTIGLVASKAKLYEYDKVVSRSLVYGSLAFVAFAIQAFAAFWIARELWYLGPGPVAITAALVAVTVFPLLEVFRRWMLRKVDRYIYRIGEDLTVATLHFRAVLASHETAKEVSELMPETVANVLNLEQAYFMPQPEVGVAGPIWASNRRRDEVLVTSVFRVRVGDSLLGLLVLGPKVSGAEMTTAERDFVETIVAEGALALLRFVQQGATGLESRTLPPGA